MIRGLAVIVSAAAALVLAAAAPAAAAASEYPTPTGRCVDTAGALQPGLCDRITPIPTADSATYGTGRGAGRR